MKCCVETRDKDKSSILNQDLTEERFFEQFAALEDGLALLQLQMRSMSENAKLFGSFVRHMRQSTCPATSGERKTFLEFESGYPETSAEVVRSKANDRHPKETRCF